MSPLSAIATIGGVVQPAQAIMIVVSDGAAPVVEANILNKVGYGEGYGEGYGDTLLNP